MRPIMINHLHQNFSKCFLKKKTHNFSLTSKTSKSNLNFTLCEWSPYNLLPFSFYLLLILFYRLDDGFVCFVVASSNWTICSPFGMLCLLMEKSFIYWIIFALRCWCISECNVSVFLISPSYVLSSNSPIIVWCNRLVLSMDQSSCLRRLMKYPDVEGTSLYLLLLSSLTFFFHRGTFVYWESSATMWQTRIFANASTTSSK